MKRPLCSRLMTSGQQAAPMLWRWRSAAPKSIQCFAGVLLLGILWAPAPTLAQTQPQPCPTQGSASQPQPGDTNPLGVVRTNTLLPDDEVFYLHLPATTEQPYPSFSYNFDEYLVGQANNVNGGTWEDPNTHQPAQSHQQFAASGRRSSRTRTTWPSPSAAGRTLRPPRISC